MKPGKHQRSKQRCQDLCWKVHDPAQSFVLLSYTIYESVTQPSRFSDWLVPSAEETTIVFSARSTSRAKKLTKAYNKEI